MDTETLCAAGERDSRTQKDIKTETGTWTDHESKHGKEAGAQTGIDAATDLRASGTQRAGTKGDQKDQIRNFNLNVLKSTSRLRAMVSERCAHSSRPVWASSTTST